MKFFKSGFILPLVLPLVLLLVLQIVFVSTVWASDFAKEKRWVEQVADFIVDGDVAMLEVDGHEIFSIYTETDAGGDENRKNRAIIVIHGLGAHPDWEQIVQPVRVEMTQLGWNTLSVQMPVLANGIGGEEYAALFDDVAPRIEAAIKFLKANAMQEIVLVSHSMGSAMSAYYLSKNPNSAISRFVAVGLNGRQGNTKMNGLNSIKSINIPMLDLYGSDDLPAVLLSAKSRAKAGAHNKSFEQKMVKDANHFFDGKNEQLLSLIDTFLEK